MAPLPSGLPEQIGDDEDLARFLTQSGHFTRQQVKPGAFLPNKGDRTTSVSRHGREPLVALRELGQAAAGARSLYGAAMLQARHVRSARLDVASDEPPQRHAVIQAWPWVENDPAEEKAQQKELALLLCSAAGEPLLFGS